MAQIRRIKSKKDFSYLFLSVLSVANFLPIKNAA